MFKILLFLLRPFLNEDGKSGGGDNITKTEQPLMTPEEAELNKMQLERTDFEVRGAKALAPGRESAQEANIRFLQQRIASQQAGAGKFQEYVGGSSLTQQRDQLRSELVNDMLAKVKGKKGWVSDAEKEKIGDLTENYRATGERDLTDFGGELQRRGEETYKSEGLRAGGFAERKGGQELTRQIAQTGRAAGMQGAQTLMALPQQNRLNLAQQLESSQRLGQKEQFGRQELMARVSGIGGGGAVGGGIGAGAGVGGGSLSSTLQQLDAARQSNATRTMQTQRSAGGQAVGGAATGAAAGATVGAQTGVSGGGVYGAVIGAVIGGIYGYATA